MSNKPKLRDGAYMYDTPRPGAGECYAGYNGGCEHYPTHGIGSAWERTAYYERKLFNWVLSVLDFEIPENWDRDFTLWVLFRCGFFGIIEGKGKLGNQEKNYGWIPQYCSPTGYNVFYQPSRIQVCNPLLRTNQIYRIGKNAAVIKLTPDWVGCWDTIHQYAEELAINEQAIRSAMLSCNQSKGIAVKKNAQAQVIKTINDAVDEGQFLVAISQDALPMTPDGKLPLFDIRGEAAKNYIVDKLLEDRETLLNQFKREIGIPVLSDKKERQLTDEIHTQTAIAATAIDVWIDSITRSVELAKKVVPGLKFSVKRVDFTEEVTPNVDAD